MEHIARIKKNYTFGNSYDFAIELKESGKMIGTCGFVCIDEANKKAEVGYVLHPSYWNQGFATEATRAVVQFCFEQTELQRLHTSVALGNNLFTNFVDAREEPMVLLLLLLLLLLLSRFSHGRLCATP